jgi:hypothetical protein
VTRLAQVVFAALVVATFGAFFVAQRLKHNPTTVQGLQISPLFSPNHDGRKDHEHLFFKLRKADDVTIEALDHFGEVVATVASNRHMAAYTPTRFVWEGHGDDGHMAPDGRYRFRVTLRHEGRAFTFPRSFVKDTKPPQVRILGPLPRRPQLLPRHDGRPAHVSFRSSGRNVVVSVFRTDPGPVELVTGPLRLRDGARSWDWDGKRNGSRVRPGTYLAVVQSRDLAGNIGNSVPVSRRSGLPRTGYGTTLPGNGGITVRYLGASPPAVPVSAGQVGQVAVDSRQRAYDWSLRKVGGPQASIRRGHRTKPVINLHAPDHSGVYLVSVRSHGHQQRVPLVVQSSDFVAGPSESKPHGVLVVLPVMTWQGRNPVDDDGDGLPNLLDRGVGVRLGRVYTGDGLPAGFAGVEAPLLGYLDRHHHRYDVTTDVELALPSPPDLERYSGVILAGDTRWLPLDVAKALRRFVTRGGRVFSVGTDSLRRQVRLTPARRIIDPTAPAPTDLFGARLGPVTHKPVSIENIEDKIDLFANGTGLFAGFDRFEVTEAFEGTATRVAAAVTSGRAVVVAERLGKGLVIRPGLPQFATRLSDDRNVSALMERSWTLLSR